jgi:lysophospholipase L1-like esterase
MSTALIVAGLALIVLALLLLGEAGARVAYTVQLDRSRPPEWFVYARDLGWDRRAGFDGADDCGIARTFDSRGLVAAEAARLKAAAAGQLRVAFLGDSHTYGCCRRTEETFVGVASRLLPHVAAVNLGVNGYTSWQGYEALLKYGDAVEPDLVFISFNGNDRRFVLTPELADGPAAFRRLHASSLILGLSEASYLLQAALRASRAIGPADATATKATRILGDMSAVDVKLDRVQPRVGPQDYRENLTRMVQWAKQRGAGVVFLLLGDNPSLTAGLREGVKLLAEAKPEAAIERLAVVKDDPVTWWFSALAHLYLAKAYKRKGEHDKAQQVLVLHNAYLGVTGGYPVALDTEYHAIVREVAAEHRVAVIDAASELDKVPEVYWDFSHFDARGHEIVGRLVADAIEAAGASRAAARGRPCQA